VIRSETEYYLVKGIVDGGGIEPGATEAGQLQAMMNDFETRFVAAQKTEAACLGVVALIAQLSHAGPLIQRPKIFRTIDGLSSQKRMRLTESTMPADCWKLMARMEAVSISKKRRAVSRSLAN